MDDSAPLGDVRYLLTFRPFAQLPATVRERYLAGRLALLPFPGSLVFWGMPTYRRLAETLPLAMQIPVLRLVPSHNGWTGLRVAAERLDARAAPVREAVGRASGVGA